MGKSLRAVLRRVGGRRRKALDPYLATRELVDSAAPVIFDVGANIGATAQRYRALYPRAAIHCFEPYPPSFARLSAALSADPLVSLHRLALSSARGSAMLNVNRNAETNSLLPSDTQAAQYWGEGLLETQSEVEVEVQISTAFVRSARSRASTCSSSTSRARNTRFSREPTRCSRLGGSG
jgi:FkbM family methyltransferase